MSTEFASAGLTAGQLNAIVKKLGGHDGALKFLRGETTVPEPERSWRKEDGAIYFSVTSDGTTGEDWITRLESKGFCMDDYANQFRSPDFRPTSGVTTEVIVFKGIPFASDDDSLIFQNISRALCEHKLLSKLSKGAKLSNLNVELACLIREKFTDEEIQGMGLNYIIAMHEPTIEHLEGFVDLLYARRNAFGFRNSWIHVSGNDLGFAFAVSESRV